MCANVYRKRHQAIDLMICVYNDQNDPWHITNGLDVLWCLLSCSLCFAFASSIRIAYAVRTANSIYSLDKIITIIKCHRGSGSSSSMNAVDRRDHNWQLNELRINLHKLFIIIFLNSGFVAAKPFFAFQLQRSCKLHNCCHFLSFAVCVLVVVVLPCASNVMWQWQPHHQKDSLK